MLSEAKHLLFSPMNRWCNTQGSTRIGLKPIDGAAYSPKLFPGLHLLEILNAEETSAFRASRDGVIFGVSGALHDSTSIWSSASVAICCQKVTSNLPAYQPHRSVREELRRFYGNVTGRTVCLDRGFDSILVPHKCDPLCDG